VQPRRVRRLLLRWHVLCGRVWGHEVCGPSGRTDKGTSHLASKFILVKA
jgi:hypothetical protein